MILTKRIIFHPSMQNRAQGPLQRKQRRQLRGTQPSEGLRRKKKPRLSKRESSRKAFLSKQTQIRLNYGKKNYTEETPIVKLKV
jgi:hypothetical protein